jgi:hypothetical protein
MRLSEQHGAAVETQDVDSITATIVTVFRKTNGFLPLQVFVGETIP